MSKRVTPIILVGLGLLAIAGCARREAPQPPPPQPRPPVTPVPGPAASPADYVARAGSLDLLFIRASELAMTRSTDARMREVARREAAAHEGTGAQLSLAGRRLNLLPSAVLRPKEERTLEMLRAEPNFDRLYWRTLVSGHSESADLHASFARSGSSPTLRPVADAAADIHRRHLAELRALR